MKPSAKKERHALDSSVLVKPYAVTRCLAFSIAMTALIAPQVIAHGGGLDSQGVTPTARQGTGCHRSGGSTTNSSGLVSGPVTLVSVGDGDTVRVTSRQGEKVTIRLACIDA